MGEELEANPVLTIDYFKRAYLINRKPTYFKKVKDLLDKENFDSQTRFGIKNYLSTEKRVKNSLKSDYPPPEVVALTPIFASHREFFLNRTCLSGKAPPGHDRALS